MVRSIIQDAELAKYNKRLFSKWENQEVTRFKLGHPQREDLFVLFKINLCSFLLMHRLVLLSKFVLCILRK